MHEWQSLSHVRWECKYHIVIIPKFRKKALYGDLRKRVGPILRDLCEQRGVELIEGHQSSHRPGRLSVELEAKRTPAGVPG